MLTRARANLALVIFIVGLAGAQASAATHHVDPSDPSAFTSVQEAINRARHFDVVVVHPGTYEEEVDFHGKAITVKSLDPNDPDTVTATIIKSPAGGSTAVSFQSGETELSVLTGLTIISPAADGINLLQDYASPQIIRCTVTGCGYDGIRGGSPTIVGCAVTENHDAGISLCSGEIRDCTIARLSDILPTSGIYQGQGDVRNCTISGNGQHGIDSHRGDVFNCVISNNGDWGIWLAGEDVTVKDCQVFGNGNGLFLSNATRSQVENCVVAGNKGFGINTNSGTATVTNCTIVSNVDDGVFCWHNGDLTVVNCIIAYNREYGFACEMASAKSNYNGFWGNGQGAYDGTVSGRANDVQATPWFIDDGYWGNDDLWYPGDYHLMSKTGRWDPLAGAWVRDPIDSPCLDKGDPTTPSMAEPYPNGGRVNLGVYGGTSEASKSEGGLSCTQYPEMDFNHDCKVDQTDLDMFLEHWLECNLEPEDACWPDGPPPAPQVQP
jgi:parallel beta-helix repeat protein